MAVLVVGEHDGAALKPATLSAITAAAGIGGGIAVLVAGSGEECLARFGSEVPDLVMVDVRMPGIGGVEAARRILGAAPHAAVIMMTMAEDVDGVARAVNAGARGYLVKDASWISLPALGATIIVTHLGLLAWELKYVALSLAHPGLKPAPPTSPARPQAT